MTKHDRPVYECKYVARSPALADLSDPVWESLPWIGDAFHPLGRSGEKARFGLKAAAVWNENALDVAFVSETAPVSVVRRQRDEDLFNECAVELFLGAGEGYYEIEVNPLGTILDLYFPNEEETNWREMAKFDAAGLQVHAQQMEDQGEWFARMHVPWSGLPEIRMEDVRSNGRVSANLARSQKLTDGTMDYATWSHADTAFCERDRMGWLILNR